MCIAFDKLISCDSFVLVDYISHALNVTHHLSELTICAFTCIIVLGNIVPLNVLHLFIL